jgi:OOP family OmpA-OmpF porin
MTRYMAGFMVLWGGALVAAPTSAVTVAMPEDARAAREVLTGPASYDLPTGPFLNGAVPSNKVEGSILKQAWQIPASGMTTLDLMQKLRKQLQDQGYKPVFECETAACGGYDFRYGIDILPEPEMHVDLGDFRFLSAQRDGAAVTVLVSRSATADFAQIIHVDPPTDSPVLTGSTMSRPEEPPVLAPAPDTPLESAPQPASTSATVSGINTGAVAGTLPDQLAQRGSGVLDGVEFASGSADLSAQSDTSISLVAKWLAQNPTQSIALVGHTDASGSLEANIALSERRARAVRQRLIEVYGIAPARIEAKGVGYLSPRDTNQTEDGRRNNRRVEVIVTSTPVQK